MLHGAKLSTELIHSTVLTSLGPFPSAVGTSDKKKERGNGSSLVVGWGTCSRDL